MPTDNNVGKRENAKNVRDEYVGLLIRNKGVHLRPEREVVYRTRTGAKVGLPFATERRGSGANFWLGLPDEDFDFVVLLCQPFAGPLLDFVLPKDVVSNIWRSLARDENNHVKFHIFRNGNGYELSLRGGRRRGAVKSLDRYLGATDSLR